MSSLPHSLQPLHSSLLLPCPVTGGWLYASIRPQLLLRSLSLQLQPLQAGGGDSSPFLQAQGSHTTSC